MRPEAARAARRGGSGFEAKCGKGERPAAGAGCLAKCQKAAGAGSGAGRAGAPTTVTTEVPSQRS